MAISKNQLDDLKAQVQKFCEARDWDPFHGAKDLAIGAVTEASELLEHFRFLSEEQVEAKLKDPRAREEIGQELADVFFFLLRFAQKYDFDLAQCFANKMQLNGNRYPVDQFKGKNHKAPALKK